MSIYIVSINIATRKTRNDTIYEMVGPKSINPLDYCQYYYQLLLLPIY